jgi:uncharacterized membrane protein (UPF0136 family)
MALVQTLSYGYSALLILGGLIGASKGSMASLIASGASAAVIIGLEQLGSSHRYAGPAGAFQLATALVLAVTMYNRYDRSGKFMPAGLVTVLSCFMTAAFGYRLASLSSAAALQKKH